jgi:flagellar motor switch/type III secretory pathway protein FliN
MKKQNLSEEFLRMQKLAGLITENYDQTEANADLFIQNPALKNYVTNNDEYGFAIMQIPVAELETAMNMSIKDILAMDEGTLSISEDPADQTVDIILDRTIEF